MPDQQEGKRLSAMKPTGLSLALAALNAAAVLGAGTAEIDVSRLKPEVLYIDLASPGAARGVALANEKEAANLTQRETAGVIGAAPANGHVVLKLDPAVVQATTPLHGPGPADAVADSAPGKS